MTLAALCRYKNVFGVPGRGAHAWRVAGVAAVDLGLTVAAAAAWSRWRGHSFWATLAVLLVLGVGVHRLFCVDTALNVALLGPVDR